MCRLITVLLGGGLEWAALQRRLGKGEVTGGGQAGEYVNACVCVGLQGLLTDLAIHQTGSIYRPLHRLHSLVPPTQDASVVLPGMLGVSTLISHLWHPNELRLLLHL